MSKIAPPNGSCAQDAAGIGVADQCRHLLMLYRISKTLHSWGFSWGTDLFRRGGVRTPSVVGGVRTCPVGGPGGTDLRDRRGVRSVPPSLRTGPVTPLTGQTRTQQTPREESVKPHTCFETPDGQLFSRFVPVMGSCSQFCFILHPHRVAVPFPLRRHGGTALFQCMATQLCSRQNWNHPSKMTQKWPKLGGREGTGTPYDFARGCDNRGQSRPIMSAIDLTAKTFFERLYLVLGLRKIAPWVSPYSRTTPTVHTPSISWFPCNFFPRMAPHFWVIKIYQVIWPSPGTLGAWSSGTNTPHNIWTYWKAGPKLIWIRLVPVPLKIRSGVNMDSAGSRSIT